MKCSYQIAEYPVYTFPLSPIDSRTYLLRDGSEALIVDPCPSEKLKRFLGKEGIQKALVLLTHEHVDHTLGVNWLRELIDCHVVCSAPCGERLQNPKKNLAAYFEALYPVPKFIKFPVPLEELATYHCQADQVYTGSLDLEWHGLRLRLMEAPGHSPGSQLIFVNERFCFSGDSLIPDTETITRFPGGSQKDYQQKTVPLFSLLPAGSILFPGHGDPAPFSPAHPSLQNHTILSQRSNVL